LYGSLHEALELFSLQRWKQTDAAKAPEGQYG